MFVEHANGMRVRINEARRPSGFYVREVGFSAPPAGLRLANVLSPIDALHFISAGRGRYCSEPIGPGSGFLIVRNQPYSFEFDAHEPWRHYWIGLRGPESERVLGEMGFPMRNHVFPAPAFGGLIGEFERVLQEEWPGEDEACRMLGFFYRVMACFARPQDTIEGGERYVSLAARFMQDNYFREITVEDAARAANVSSRYLYKLFLRLRGCPPSEYLTRCRLQKSRILLQESSLPVSEIARAVGYREAGYFSTCFKRAYGLSPGRFRAQAAPEEGREGDA